ncbi:MAG: phosphatase PAP2 family protein [Planctomycetes bacterium]|nr:phosphatase PAP2 family protein [Planctomycetota bacterium]
MLLFGGIVGVVLVVAKPRRWRYLLLLLTAAVVANRACWLFKVAVSRDRSWASGLECLHGIIDPAHAGTSFPSSHATTIAAVSLLLGLMTARPRLAVLGGIAGLGLGSLRVFAGAHYPSDVLAGWGLGALTVYGGHVLVNRRSRAGRGSEVA